MHDIWAINLRCCKPMKGTNAKRLQRIFFVVVSLAGIIYELTQVEAIRWPLLAGYTFVVSISLYLMVLKS